VERRRSETHPEFARLRVLPVVRALLELLVLFPHRYIKGLSFEAFTRELRLLNERRISYILSYDGRANDKVYGKPMPEDLDLFRIELDAGRSTQATFLGKDVTTYESLYLSPALAERTGKVDTSHLTRRAQQTTLFDDSPVIEWQKDPIYQKSS
jgi:DNA adenine methylase